MTGTQEVTQGKLTDPAPRANKYGDPCPAWCATDHHTPFAETKRGPIYEDVHKSAGGHEDLLFGAHARQFSHSLGYTPEPEVIVRAATQFLPIPADEAESAAKVLEAIAAINMTPAQLRQLAARVRAAAAVIGAAQ